MPRVIGIIPARYGSTRFLGKPLVKIGHKSLLAWTYFHASLSTTLEDLLVATDDGRILEECKSFGAKAILTSPTHNSGTDRLCEVVSQIPETDLIVVNIQGDEPDIDPKLIDGVVNLTAWTTKRFGDLLRKPQTGIIQAYLILTIIGLVILIYIFV